MARQPVLIACAGATLAGMAHPGGGATGVLIVPGGPQTRHGSHRGFVAIADALAANGHPVLRFDRRGLGDSDGDDPGYQAIGPDIAAARLALLAAFPNVRRVVGWGLCDGAAALALDPGGFDALILVNPWTIETDRAPALPQRAAIAARYRARLLDPSRWGALLAGRIDLAKAARGLLRVARAEPAAPVACRMAAALARYRGRVLIPLAGEDNTARAFAALWRAALFAPVRAHGRAAVAEVGGATHTFARPAAARALARLTLEFVAAC